MSLIEGFSRLSREEKVDLVVGRFLGSSPGARERLRALRLADPSLQARLEEFSENTLTNFPCPYGVVPNVLVNGRALCVPMVTEESSVVAAASAAAKHWFVRGGVRASVLGREKVGQVHFTYRGDPGALDRLFSERRPELLAAAAPVTASMEARGGGLRSLELAGARGGGGGRRHLLATFRTCDAMGANFINSVLEALGRRLAELVASDPLMEGEREGFEVVLCIVSNYTPECLVRAEASCPAAEFSDPSGTLGPGAFARRFEAAVRIAEEDVHRAVTHNKGIFNGIDAVVLATGNDFRAVEACGHAFAARGGRYRGLSSFRSGDGEVHFSLEVPLALGTVGGLTSLHPMAELSLDLLGRPSAEGLMEVVAAAGLLQNFAALASLVTTGIQRGHMRMHLLNILNHLGATEEERRRVKAAFLDRAVSFKDVREELGRIRAIQ